MPAMTQPPPTVPTAPGHRALRRGRVSIPGCIYLVTATTEGRIPYLGDFHAACAMARLCHETRIAGDAALLAWVLMPDHGHWLLQLGDHDALGQAVGRLKSATAREGNCALGRTGAFWAPAFHDRALRAEDDLKTMARYVVANPVRAGLVARVGDYPFWNAVWL